MPRNARFLAACATVAAAGTSRADTAPAWHAAVVYETGPAYIVQNDGRYGVNGTPYEAADVGQQKTLLRTARTSLELGGGRHTVILLYAPFAVTTRVTLADDLQFRDASFAAGTVVDHRYVFDGFRGSYLYEAVRHGGWSLGLGGSLQIRSADVAFTSVDGRLHAAQDDIGLVPAAKLRLRYTPRCGPWGQLEADGLSTFGLVGDTSGAIYDVGLTAGLPVGRGLDLFVTARWLGGGAEVPSKHIDNWANFASLAAGVRVALDRVLLR